MALKACNGRGSLAERREAGASMKGQLDWVTHTMLRGREKGRLCEVSKVSELEDGEPNSTLSHA